MQHLHLQVKIVSSLIEPCKSIFKAKIAIKMTAKHAENSSVSQIEFLTTILVQNGVVHPHFYSSMLSVII